MRITLEHRRDDRATIQRREQTGSNDLGEPTFDQVTVDSGVSCRFTPATTDLAREDFGERTERPATVAFPSTTDIQTGDTVDVAGRTQTFEARQVEQVRDTRRSRVLEEIAELERVD